MHTAAGVHRRHDAEVVPGASAQAEALFIDAPAETESEIGAGLLDKK
jgi:hypothetical protein